LVEKIGFEVVHFQYPAEMYFLTSETIPKSISGAFTTAVANLSMIYNPDEVILFRLPLDQVVPDKREHVRTIYDFYAKRGFNIIDFND
jgi:hypothetical protein